MRLNYLDLWWNGVVWCMMLTSPPGFTMHTSCRPTSRPRSRPCKSADVIHALANGTSRRFYKLGSCCGFYLFVLHLTRPFGLDSCKRSTRVFLSTSSSRGPSSALCCQPFNAVVSCSSNRSACFHYQIHCPGSRQHTLEN